MATVGITIKMAAPLALALALALGSAQAAPKVSGAPGAPGPLTMQVEEPKPSSPMSARESKAWQKNHARGLTEAQKKAFRERKEKMEALIAVIKEKRKAMAKAKPEERAAIARELHNLMLEKDPGAGLNPAGANGTARVGAAADKAPVASDDKSAKWRSAHKDKD